MTLFTANDVARFCSVDLKTIHNWADKGKIPHHRTLGRHLRFRRLDVIDFLRAYAYAVPESLFAERPRVALIDEDAPGVAAARRALARRLELVVFTAPLLGLLSLAALDPEALVLGDCALDAPAVVAQMKSLALTRHIRVIVCSSHADRRDAAIRAGASEFVAKHETARLREAVERVVAVRG